MLREDILWIVWQSLDHDNKDSDKEVEKDTRKRPVNMEV